MPAFTLDRLREVMSGCGVEDGVDLYGDIEDASFPDLGYDSLAVLQILTVVSRETGVPIRDEAVLELTTPRQILDHVNGQTVSA